MKNQVVQIYENTIRRKIASSTPENPAEIRDEVTRSYLEHLDRQDMLRHVRIAVMGTWLLIVAITVLVLSGCGSTWRAPEYAPLSMSDQAAKAVRIENACLSGDPYNDQKISVDGGFGSGVIVANGVVLTAYHVVKCPPNTVRMVRVVGVDDIKRWGELVEYSADRDIARLYVNGATGPRVEIVAPVIGEEICAALAHPLREFACGLVTHIQPKLTKSNGTIDIWHSARTIPGNSGAGMFNRRGQLVGLATNCYEDGTGGLATSLRGRMP